MDHRAITKARDHRAITKARDHRAITKARDHRAITKARDHRAITKAREHPVTTERDHLVTTEMVTELDRVDKEVIRIYAYIIYSYIHIERCVLHRIAITGSSSHIINDHERATPKR